MEEEIHKEQTDLLPPESEENKQQEELREEAIRSEEILSGDRKKGFFTLIQGEYKDVFDETVNGILKEKFGELRRAQQAKQKRAEEERMVEGWLSEEQELKGVYPEFSLRAEFDDPQFAKLLKSGVPVKTAYRALHLDELLTGAVEATASAVKKQVADNIRFRGERPVENGVSAQGGVVLQNDVAKLTPKERRELARRAASGEEIRF